VRLEACSSKKGAWVRAISPAVATLQTLLQRISSITLLAAIAECNFASPCNGIGESSDFVEGLEGLYRILDSYYKIK